MDAQTFKCQPHVASEKSVIFQKLSTCECNSISYRAHENSEYRTPPKYCIYVVSLLLFVRIDGPYDTSSEDAVEQTYVPALTTFEEEMEINYPKLPPLVHLDVDKLSKMYEREKKLEKKVYW